MFVVHFVIFFPDGLYRLLVGLAYTMAYFLIHVQNNITEIRADALKLLVMLRRPVPRADATIGAWLNIFQVCIIHFKFEIPIKC